MSERELSGAVCQVWGQSGDLPLKTQSFWPFFQDQFQSGGMPPARQPAQQFYVREHHALVSVAATGMPLGQQLDELPIFGREKLLLVRVAVGQFHDFAERS